MELAKLLELPHSEILMLSSKEWAGLAKQLEDAISEELCVSLEGTGVVLPDPGEVQPGLVLSFQSDSLAPEFLALKLEGIAGIQSDPDSTSISASLFLFLQGNRLKVEGLDYYEITLGLGEGGRLVWQHSGWVKDLYWEFEQVLKWGEISS